MGSEGAEDFDAEIDLDDLLIGDNEVEEEVEEDDEEF